MNYSRTVGTVMFSKFKKDLAFSGRISFIFYDDKRLLFTLEISWNHSHYYKVCHYMIFSHVIGRHIGVHKQ